MNMKKMFLVLSLLVFVFTVGTSFAADIVPDVIMMPGTQPGEVNMESIGRCLNCHKNYETNPRVEPGFGWMGSAMGNAGRDPIFWATLAIAEQDFDGAGDLCIRCHSAGGWIGGRSTPTDASGLAASDDNGIDCETCHLLTNPDQQEHVGTMFDPFIANCSGDLIAPDGTCHSATEGYYGSGMMVMSNDYGKLGPYNTGDAVARHAHSGSDFHRDTDFCGTCHDVSNSAVGQLAPNGGTQPGAPAVIRSGELGYPLGLLIDPNYPSQDPNILAGMAAFNNPAYAYGIVERTYSEYMSSPFPTKLVDDFGTLPADLQDVRGSLYNAYMAATTGGTRSGNYVDGDLRYFSCQTCHMRAITGRGCDKNNAPNRLDQPMHDQTGGNYWVFPLIQYQDTKGTLRMGGGLSAEQIEAMNDGTLRAKTHLTQAATLDVVGNTARITNMTGHKLITGYPEGRRMWLNIKFYNASGVMIEEVGKWGPLTGATASNPVDGEEFVPWSIVDIDNPKLKVYEVHPAMTKDWAALLIAVGYPADMPLSFDRLTGDVDCKLGELAEVPSGTPPCDGGAHPAYHETFHFALNNYVASDNRIPPYQMDYYESLRRNAQPVPANQYGGSSGGVYNHWDDIDIAALSPADAIGADLTLYYQGTSWEYVRFLNNAVDTTDDGLGARTPVTPFLADEGKNFLDAWLNALRVEGQHTHMVPPHIMATATWGTTPQCEPASEICDDGKDNDCDGLIDCEDSDCNGNPACPPALIEWPMCLDNEDNDNDGLIDCADRTDCDGYTETCGVGVCESTGSYCDNGTRVDVTCTHGDPTEPGTEITCGDGLDNDCDGLTDTEDSDCQADCTAIMDRNVCRNTSGCEWVGGKNGTCQYAVACEPTEPGMEMTCNDGVDNDCDGVIDCADPDCGNADNCQVVCTDIPTKTECLDAGCMWNNKKGCR
jgi:hypothetical protein